VQNAEEVRQLYDDGILIGSHSTDHYRMDKCTEAELATQIVENIDFLKDLLKTDIEHFSIPFGKKEHYDKNVIEKIFAGGHKFVYSTNIVSFEADKINKPRFLFPRLGILNQTPEEIMFQINRTFIRKYDQ
jgi:peptidoglycan/xylan/chitin deacetylase (PgdA/CDA1 family)